MRISQRGQITIPKKLRDRFGMHHDVEVEVVPTEDGLLIRKHTDTVHVGDSDGIHPVDKIYGILNRPGWSTDEYMKEIRGR